jgi:hypothetical protein
VSPLWGKRKTKDGRGFARLLTGARGICSPLKISFDVDVDVDFKDFDFNLNKSNTFNCHKRSNKQ